MLMHSTDEDPSRSIRNNCSANSMLTLKLLYRDAPQVMCS